ncbi:MAG TPA: DUF2804 domain-containing protein [Clostridia bacterium]|jgi:hypothetical protein|nr:DUF2804 domain-containing protein [Clostridia bacterium]
MQRQTEITEPTLLLDKDGNLTKPGWCRKNLFIYNRDAITAPRCRIKEWDFYQIGNDRFVVQICFANISLGAAATATLINLRTGKTYSAGSLSLFTKNRYRLPDKSDQPHTFNYKKSGACLGINVTDKAHILQFEDTAGDKPFKMEFVLETMENHESITIATPFDLKGRFFYTNKINCMPATGKAVIGDEVFEFSKEDSFGVLDWGRGVWPYKNTWYWGNGCTRIDGKLFGFEITWGFGDESNATETAVFYDGKCHKIGPVDVEMSPVGRWMEPWAFKSEDGRFNFTMTPFYDNATGIKVLGLVGTSCHQVHGYWNGTAVLDDGTVLEVKDMYAFCERMENLW